MVKNSQPPPTNPHTDPDDPFIDLDDLPSNPKDEPIRIRTQARYSDKERLMILQKLGCWEKWADIVKWSKTALSRPVSLGLLSNYCSSNKNTMRLVQKFREQYEAKTFQEEYSSKRRRVQELSKIYDELISSGNLSEARKTLDSIREEVESKRVTEINVYNQYNYNDMSDVDIENKRLEILESIKQLKSRQITFQPDKNGENSTDIIDTEVEIE